MRDDRLLSPLAVRGLCAGAEPSRAQQEAAGRWLALLEAGSLAGDHDNRRKFARIVLSDMLGYPIGRLQAEHGRTGLRYGSGNGMHAVCFDAAGTEASDLFAPQPGAKAGSGAPAERLWDRMWGSGAGYGVCTDYRRFVLLSARTGTQKRHEFDFGEVGRDPSRLAEFVAVFSRESIEGGRVGRALDETVREESGLAGEFFDLYGKTRRMLVMEFEECGAARGEAVSAAQLFLDRLLFVFVAEDTGLVGERGLFAGDMADILLNTNPQPKSKYTWRYTHHELFEWFDKGSDDPAVSAFGGGLFNGAIDGRLHFLDRRKDGFFGGLERRGRRRSWRLAEEVERAIRAHADINPVIKNLLALSSYDYEGQVRAGVLGRVLDRSLAELGELSGGRCRGTAGRAPEYMARYVCRRTIVPHLSRSGTAESPASLVAEYADDLGALDDRLARIRILDPACGSGAFLAEAASTLLDVRRAMRGYREAGGGIDRGTLDPAIDDAGIRSIVRDNVYGLGADEYSVGTARLGLHLLSASRGESLPDLSRNMAAGDIAADGALEEAFPGAFGGGRPEFSVVVGSPPRRGRTGDAAPRRPARMPAPGDSGGHEPPRADDPECRFWLRSLESLADGGRLGFVSSGGWLRPEHGLALQRAVLDNAEIESIVVPEFRVFEDDDGDDGAGAAVALLRRGRPRAGSRVELARARSARDFVRMRRGAVSRVGQDAIRPGDWRLLFRGAAG